MGNFSHVIIFWSNALINACELQWPWRICNEHCMVSSSWSKLFWCKDYHRTWQFFALCDKNLKHTVNISLPFAFGERIEEKLFNPKGAALVLFVWTCNVCLHIMLEQDITEPLCCASSLFWITLKLYLFQTLQHNSLIHGFHSIHVTCYHRKLFFTQLVLMF